MHYREKGIRTEGEEQRAQLLAGYKPVTSLSSLYHCATTKANH